MYNTETQGIFRKFYTHLRVVNEYKLEILAKELDISTSYISQWENNKRNLSNNLVSKLLTHFGYNYETVIENYEKNIDILFTCFLDIVYIKNTDRFTIFEENLPDNFSKSMEYPSYLAIKYIYNCAKPNIALQKEIESLIPLLSEDFLGIYYLSLGCSLYNSKKHKEAILRFREGLKSSSNPYITSMLHYNIGNSLNETSEITKSIEHISLAKTLFEQCFAVRRALVCLNSLGTSYISNSEYEEAIKAFNYILKISFYLNDSYLDNRVETIWLGLIYS